MHDPDVIAYGLYKGIIFFGGPRMYHGPLFWFCPSDGITGEYDMVTSPPKGRIIFFNPYAGRFLEIPDNQILMTHSRDVMMFINNQTGEQLKDPVPEVVQQMVGVMHEFNTAVVTRSGKHHPASVIVRPIKDDHNKILGVFMYIKEKTRDQIKMANIK